MALLLDNQFAQLPNTNEVTTKEFLDSVSYLPPFFDCLGSKVFAPIKADINGNITKIRAVYDSDPAKYETLQKILEVEKGIYGSEWPKAGATLALMWLKRGLRFIQILLQSLADGERDENNPNLIRVNITKAYDQALKRYHGWIVQKVFKVPQGSRLSEFLTGGECSKAICINLITYTSKDKRNSLVSFSSGAWRNPPHPFFFFFFYPVHTESLSSN
uniref:Glycolipid transfer protein domain-containing protein n=1 Tax=Pygocentrus nattereri TaxID=42514 RepID=A0A3B4E867_PYGNA